MLSDCWIRARHAALSSTGGYAGTGCGVRDAWAMALRCAGGLRVRAGTPYGLGSAMARSSVYGQDEVLVKYRYIDREPGPGVRRILYEICEICTVYCGSSEVQTNVINESSELMLWNDACAGLQGWVGEC